MNKSSTAGDLQGHAEFSQGYHQGSYAYTTPALSSVASNSGHDINKPVAAAQQAMYSSAGMPAPSQHHQSMGGPIASPQPIIQQGQQMSRNPTIAMPTAYYQRNNVPPRTMQSMPRNPISAVVNQPGQQPSSQYAPMPTMVPIQHNFNSFPPTLVNHQFPQMYQHRAYNAPQYPVIPSQQYLWNYNTPPPQNSNGYFPSHGMSSYQSMPPQMPPQSIPAQPQQQHSRKGEKAIPIIDPKTGKNVLSIDKNAEDSSRPNSEKESENSDSNICVQFATQVAAVLNDSRSDITSKQPESVRIDTLCSHENEGIRMPITPVVELVDENISELQNIENLSEVEFTENTNLICNDEIGGPYYRKDIDSNSIIESESGATKNVDLEAKTEDREQNVFEVPVESSVPDKEESIKTEKLNSSSNVEKVVVFSEIKKINNVKSIIESDCSNSIQESLQPIVASVKEELVQPNNSEILESSSAVSTKIPEKILTEGKKNKAKKKKDYNKRGESKEGGEMDAFLDTKEGAAVSPAPLLPPVTATAPTSVPTIVSERTPSPVPIVDSEILSTIPLPGEIPDIMPQNDISPSDPTSETSSVSPSADSEDKENVAETQKDKIVLKYSYKEDQWSPLNPEGKKQYDREFLLQLQSQPMSLCKPNNLPNLDVIKDKAHIQKLTEVNRVPPPVMNNPMRAYDPFMPGFARGGPMPRMPHAPVNRRSQGRGGEKPRKVISFTSSLNQNIKLHESQNAWKPLHKSEIPPDEKDKLKRSVQGVLNKLTPQKFETLLSQLKGLNIDTEEKLALVIDLIFEKAIDEPNFSVPYANLCKHLALIKVPVSGTGTQVNFRKLLLTKCQKEFEQDRSDELKNEEKMKTLEAADPDKRKELQFEYEEEEKKIRYRQLGNIRFIGELFKLGMLIEPIMHECIKKLLSQGDEESLECLCRLLKTIGKELDDTKATKNSRDNQMDMYFAQMKLIVDKRLTSSRVRFMLQDVIDLKKNNWVPRRDENNPKTIDQIHKEAEREAREQQQVYQNMTNYPKRIADDRDRRKNAGRMGPSEDGWTSSSKSNKGSYSVVDPSKLKLTKPDEVESIRLGPGGRGLQSWGRGSSGGTKTTADSDKTALTNRFSALSEQSLSSNYEGRRGSQRSAASSRESSRGRNSQLPPAIRKTPSTSKERENLLETVKGLTRTSEAKAPEVKAAADVHVNGKAVAAEDLALNGPEYNEDDMERKTKPLIDEFLHNNDFEEAIKCVTELASPNTVHMFINAAINQVLERSSQARYSLGQLLSSLLKKKIITFDQYKKGFAGVLEIIDDYALDIPLIWDYMGEILEPMIEDIETPFKLLKEVLQPCIPSEKAGMLVSSILHCAAKRKGTIKLGEVWRESGVQWTDIIGTDRNVSEFIEKHKLEFTVSPTKVNPQTQMSMEEMKKHLLSLLEKNSELEEVFDWVDANISDTSGPTFVRALVTAVHESCLTGSGTTWELNTSKLKSRIPLISRYVSTNEKLQLQALYAVQALMNQLGQPSGLLHQIFDVLYDDDVISDESFKEWEQSDDPNEAEGKGVAVHSVKSFFTWLREPEEETEEMNSV
ncbi:eukaryotic translation initiation factor 4 gamma 3-like isoform X2 [Argiope bruennichi]|uniref:eukaryotic translation initiation factor 4 gamma 3-like isoform X2 n=1 Tax=Argiope bruennichi TaxID=94029 RepID=UPI0024943CB5|nr:eukaryotic translation initiation factor 4 gamma 3-like isoform X2 [Argiope bruennichi]